MRKIIILLFTVLMASAFNGWGQIISQYIETNSGTYPKGIEIWNNTGSVLDFSSNTLMIKKGVNGGAPASDFTLSSGTLASGEVIVIGTSDMETTTTGNGSVFHLEPFTFNGNDALEVWYGLTKTDVFGEPGVDPGSAWIGNGVSTANQNIQLKTGVIIGNTDGWTDPSERLETVSTDPSGDGGQVGFGIAPLGLWKIDAASNDWASSSNWSGGNAPTSVTNITIPSGGTNYPTISAAATCNNITIESGASLIGSENLTVSGTAIMQRTVDAYTTNANGWHLLSSPVNNMTIAGSDFVPGTNSPNLDDFYAWSESGWEWLNYKISGNNITNFVNGTGYLVSYETTATKDFTGTFNNADVSFTNLSKTTSKGYGNGWHLMGNPYQSALQWTDTDWVRTNIGTGAKIMNSGGSYTDITVDGTDIIPANQGFFIQALTHNSNTFTIPKSQRVHSSTAFYKNSIPNMLTLKAVDGNYYQESCIQFMDGSTPNYDENYDVHFLSGMSGTPQFYSIIEQEYLSTNRMTVPENESVVLMGFSTQNECIISIESIGVESFSEGLEILLEDLQEDITVDLRQNPVYTFESKPEYDIERFRVHFKSSTGINDSNIKNNQIQIYSSNYSINIINNKNLTGDINIVNLFGQVIANYELVGDSKQQINFTAPTGLYIVSIKLDNGFVISEKVIIK